MERSHASTIEEANAVLIVDGNLDMADEYFTADYVAHLTERDLDGGPSAVRWFVGLLRSGFSDLQVEVDILLEGENRVAWQRTVRGKHVGDFMGFPASGREIVWRDMITSQFRDGLIAEEWALTDLAERLLLSRFRTIKVSPSPIVGSVSTRRRNWYCCSSRQASERSNTTQTYPGRRSTRNHHRA